MNLQLDIEQLIWAIPLALVAVAVLQIIYLFLLNYAPTRKEAPPRPPQQPSAPIMPPIRSGGDVPYTPQPVSTMQMGAPASGSTAPAAAPTRLIESMGKFVVMSGLKNLGEIPLPSSSFGIGRFVNTGSNVLVGLDEKSISRKHAVFICDEQLREYYVMDTHSSFGTAIVINGQPHPITPEKQERVYNEDIVQFGSAVKVRLVLPTEKRP